MRPPRLLALLIVLAALLATGAWWFVRQQPAAVASEPTDSAEIEAHKSGEAALESNTTAERKAEPAIAESGPNAKQHPIVLADSTRIHGRVVRGALELPVAGLEIVCTQDLAPMRIETPFVIDDDGKRMFGMPANMPKGSRSSCTSAADGSFEFKGLDRASLYTLSARGNGWVLVAPLASIAPSEEPRVLAVQRIYVARVLALDEDGKPPASECQYLRYVRIAGPGECDSVPLADSPPQNFRDLKLPAANEAATPSEGRSYTFASDCDAARLGPFRVLICCSGFERQDFEFWAYPEEQQAEATVLRMQRAAVVTGSLRVHQDCECKESSCAHLLEGRVVLEPVEPGAQTLEFELTGLVREQTFLGIPGGTWHARVFAKHGGWCHPPLGEPPLEIVCAHAASLLHLPVGNLGAIRWKLRGPAEQLASEALPLNWRENGAPASVQLWMSVVMRGIEAGAHEFEFDAARYSSVEGASCVVGPAKARLSVDVKPGETQTVVVHTP